MAQQHTIQPVFSHEEARVIACLMEKQLTTPKNYPLTLNSLTLACNQKSSREPIMNLTEGQIGHIASILSEREFISTEFGERANRYFHRTRSKFSLERDHQAVLAVLMLRKSPQTINEIKTRTSRMTDFSNSEQILEILEDLMTRETALITQSPSTSGQREDRYAHTLCGEVKFDPLINPAPLSKTNSTDKITALEHRITELEKRLRNVEQRIDK